MPNEGAANGKPRGWIPSGKEGLVVLTLLAGGTFGSYKIIDASVESEIKSNAAQINLLAARTEALGQKVGQVEAALTAMQSDRLQDLRTVFERGSAIQGHVDTLSRQLNDIKQGLEGIERRTAETDRDIKQNLGELRGEVNHALRAPLVGPQRR